MNEYVGNVAVGGIVVELVGGEEVRSEAVLEPRCVDQRGERQVRRRVAVDAPGQAVGFEPVEDRLGGVVDRERVRRRQVHDVAGRGGRVEERPVGERLRRHFAEPVVEHREPAGQRRDSTGICWGV